MPNSQLTAVLFMVLSMVAYQISASFAKQLFEVLDPITVVTLRLCFASILIIFNVPFMENYQAFTLPKME